MPGSTSSSPPGHVARRTKGHLIEELRTLENKWARCHDAITGYTFHTWRSQSSASVALAENLLGLNYRAVAKGGKIGCEERYEDLKQKEIWEARGAVREAKQALEEIFRRLMGFKQTNQGRNIRDFDRLMIEIKAIMDQ